MLYSALVEAHLNYGLTVWGGASKYLIDRLERTQNSVISNLTLSRRADNADYRQLGVLKVSNLYKYRIVTKYYYNREYRIQRREYQCTRGATKFHVRRTNNKYGDRLKSKVIPEMLNELPDSLRYIERIGTMKKELKEWLLKIE